MEEITLTSLGDKLLAGLFVDDSLVVSRRKSLLFTSTLASAFRDEQHIIYKVLQKFKTKDFRVDSKFMRLYLANNIKLLVDSSRFIDITAYSDNPSEYQTSYIAGVVDYFGDNIEQGVDITDEDYSRTLEEYRILYQNEEAYKLYSDSVEIVDDSLRVGRKTLSGFEDARDHVRRGLAEIEGTIEISSGQGFLSLDDLVTDDGDIYSKGELICDYGDIVELNEHFGGIYTQNLITVAGPNKGGKTKFCLNLVYNAVTRFGQNVTIWPIEGGVQSAASELRAIHFDRTVNRSIDSMEDAKTGVTRDVIQYDKWNTPNFRHPDWKEMEYAFAKDLATNPKYGRIDFIDRNLHIDTFLDEIDTSVKSNGSSLILIDYLALLKYDYRRMANHEAIKMAYQQVLNYAKKNNVTVISPAQYTQDTIEKLGRGNTSDLEMRNSVGGSAEILRASDIAFTLWSSTQDLANNRMTLLSIPTRNQRPFESFEILVDLGTCTFMSHRH